MTKPLLAFGLWCVAFAVGVVGLITSGPGNPRFTGTVVFDFKPFCQSFVVQTERGFVLLEWEDGTLFSGGRRQPRRAASHNRGSNLECRGTRCDDGAV